MHKSFLVYFFLFLSFSAYGQSPKEEKLPENAQSESYLSRLHLLSFSLFGQGRIKEIGPDIGLSWNPTFHLVPHHWELVGHVGTAYLIHEHFSKNIEFKVLGAYIINKRAFVETGPIWKPFTPLGHMVGVSINGGPWFGERPLLYVLDRFFVGFNYLKIFPTGRIMEYRFGLGIAVF